MGLCNIAKVCALCSDSSVEYDEAKMKYRAVGEPTEAALKVLVEKLGMPGAEDNVVTGVRCNDQESKHTNATPADATHLVDDAWKKLYRVTGLLEFSRARKSMSVLCTRQVGEARVREA